MSHVIDILFIWPIVIWDLSAYLVKYLFVAWPSRKSHAIDILFIWPIVIGIHQLIW